MRSCWRLMRGPQRTEWPGNPGGSLHSTAIYFAGTRQVYRGRKIVLNAAADALVNNAQQLTNVVPDYAPAGQHFSSAVVLGWHSRSDRELAIDAMHDLRRIFADDAEAQAPSIPITFCGCIASNTRSSHNHPASMPRCQTNRTAQPGLYAAAEWTEGSSINGAMTSGERCAAAIVADRTKIVAV